MLWSLVPDSRTGKKAKAECSNHLMVLHDIATSDHDQSAWTLNTAYLYISGHFSFGVDMDWSTVGGGLVAA